LTLKAPIDHYFDKVLVNCEDEALKANRLAMIQLVAAEFLSVADFSRIPA
jgi:glycyl-tRNA synthetase beta chain